MENYLPVKFEFLTKNIEVRKEKEKDKRFFVRGYASVAEVVDRQDEIVSLEALKGAIGALLREGDTLFFNHNYNEPIGKLTKGIVDKKGLFIEAIISETRPDIQKLIEEDILKRFSIGGEVIEAEVIRDEKRGKEVVRIIKLNLYEVSLVGVPANAKAEVVDYVLKSAITKARGDGQGNGGSRQGDGGADVCVCPECDKTIPHEKGKPCKEIKCPECGAIMIGKNKKKSSIEKSTISYKPENKTDENVRWDGAGARRRGKKWASSDGSGDKDKMNWTKYARLFTWFDSEKKESFGVYKLPHHDVIQDRVITVWRGVAAAMAALLGARGGTKIPTAQKKSVYNHLKKHYEQYDKKVPEFKEYTPEEILEIYKDNIKEEEEAVEKSIRDALENYIEDENKENEKLEEDTDFEKEEKTEEKKIAEEKEKESDKENDKDKDKDKDEDKEKEKESEKEDKEKDKEKDKDEDKEKDKDVDEDKDKEKDKDEDKEKEKESDKEEDEEKDKDKDKEEKSQKIDPETLIEKTTEEDVELSKKLQKQIAELQKAVLMNHKPALILLNSDVEAVVTDFDKMKIGDIVTFRVKASLREKAERAKSEEDLETYKLVDFAVSEITLSGQKKDEESETTKEEKVEETKQAEKKIKKETKKEEKSKRKGILQESEKDTLKQLEGMTPEQIMNDEDLWNQLDKDAQAEIKKAYKLSILK